MTKIVGYEQQFWSRAQRRGLEPMDASADENTWGGVKTRVVRYAKQEPKTKGPAHYRKQKEQ